jgi:hypothetical protein
VAVLLITLIEVFKVFNPLENLKISQQNLGLIYLTGAYVIAFTFGSFLIRYTFSKIIKFSLLKNSAFLKKIIISLLSVSLARLIYYFLAPPLTNNFLYFTLDLLIAGSSFLLFFVVFSEFFQDQNYLEFKKKILFNFKKLFKKV